MKKEKIQQQVHFISLIRNMVHVATYIIYMRCWKITSASSSCSYWWIAYIWNIQSINVTEAGPKICTYLDKKYNWYIYILAFQIA